MTIAHLTFAHPAWLLAGVGATLAVLLLGLRLDRQRQAALLQFGSRGRQLVSSVARLRRAVKRTLVALGVLCGFCALARPQSGFRHEETQRRGVDLLFALDTSKSMLAPDLKPNRLFRAKLAVRDLVERFGGDRVGLVAFAGDAFLQCPLTLDRDIFAQTLDAVDTELIPRGGTDVGRAIDVGRDALRNQPGNQKLLVLLTDGEDLESRAVEAARQAGREGIRIYTVGVGTPAGEQIPLGGSYVQDESGAVVRSRLDEPALQAIAAASGGRYRPLGTDGRGLESLYQEVLARLPKQTLTSQMKEVPIERFQWPLALATLCLAMEPLLRERKRRRRAEPALAVGRGPHGLGRAMGAAAVLVAVCAGSVASASPRSAERAYRDGDYPKAHAEYRQAAAARPDSAVLQFNSGAAAYKSGDFRQAQSDFDQALHSAPPELQAQAYYDRGNTRFRIGQGTVEQQPEQTIEQWKQAIADYESALKLNAKDTDAAYNRDLVKRKLEELMRQQKQDADKKKQPQQSAQNQQQDKQNQTGQQEKQAQNQSGQQGTPTQKQSGPQGTQGQGRGSEQDGDAEGAGQLSRADARALLDSLRGEGQLVRPAASGKHVAASDDTVRRDW